MTFNHIIRVSEFEKLYYDDHKPFKKRHWEALCRYLESANKHGEMRIEYFRILNKGIQFTHYVGVIQAGNLTIEILPKTDKSATTAQNESIDFINDESMQQWHQALLQMLGECSLLKVHTVGFANLNMRHHSILDMYIELFLATTEGLLHEGLIKKYEKEEGNQTVLKGQLLFQKQITGNSTHDERFYVRHTAYHHNHVYNHIVYKTLQHIARIHRNSYLSEKAGRLLLNFPQTNSIRITADTFNRLSFDRKTERYRDALLIAKMLLLNYRPDITGGAENVMAILFDMNLLWEEWVYRRLKKAETDFGISVHRQQSTDFWKGEFLPRHKTIRPDIVIQKGNETIIIDTKWKLVENMTPDDDDLKQMFVYNLYWTCDKSVLIYPASVANYSKGNYKHFSETDKTHSQCEIITAIVLKDNQLSNSFADEVLEKFFQKL